MTSLFYVVLCSNRVFYCVVSFIKDVRVVLFVWQCSNQPFPLINRIQPCFVVTCWMKDTGLFCIVPTSPFPGTVWLMRLQHADSVIILEHKNLLLLRPLKSQWAIGFPLHTKCGWEIFKNMRLSIYEIDLPHIFWYMSVTLHETPRTGC